MKISITGDLGSGKSTVAKQLAKDLGFDYVSTGTIFREIAKEYGIDVLKLNKLALTDTSIDDRVDGKLKEYNQHPTGLIIDSRLAWHFINESIKIYFEVDPLVAAQRVFGDNSRNNEQKYPDINLAYYALQDRKRTENQRYLDRYGIDCDHIGNYDLVVNTSLSDVPSICDLLAKIIANYPDTPVAKYWLDPRMLYPTENIRILAREETKMLKIDIRQNGYDKKYPITCIKVNGYYFIWDGHKRCSAAIENAIAYVPVQVIAIDTQEIHPGHSAVKFVTGNIDMRKYYDWEDAHNFQYLSYPKVTE